MENQNRGKSSNSLNNKCVGEQITNQSNTKIYCAMVMAAFFWAGAFIAGKMSVQYIPVYSLTFLRFFFGTVILFVLIKLNIITTGENGEKYKLKKEHIPIFLFTGIVGMVFYHVFFFSALNYTTAINSSIIASMNPTITALIGVIFAKQYVSRRMALGIFISLCGVILTITGANIEALMEIQVNKGDLLMVVAAVAWAVYAVFSKSKGAGINPVVLTYYSFLVCTVVMIPFVIYEKPWKWLGDVPLPAMMAVLYMSIFASVIGYLIQQIAIKKIGPSRSSIFVNLVPVFSIVLSIVILKEEPSLIKLLTAIIIIIGVCICQSGQLKVERN